MNMMKSCVLAVLCWDLGALALAAPIGAGPGEGGNAAPAAPVAVAERRGRPCQRRRSPERTLWPNGTMLWGTRRKVARDEASSVLMSVDLGGVQREGEPVGEVKVEGGRLVASRAPAAAGGGAAGEDGGLAGAIFRGTASDGQPVEVAICEAEPAAEDREMVWYGIELWSEAAREWQNPCATTARVPMPRALAVRGVWDAQGGHREVPGKFTFACEGGAIVKCIGWGYRPWRVQGGRSLVDYHQACTRMARADYCGDGRSHTKEGTTIDIYDNAGVLQRTLTAVEGWDPAKGSLEAVWTPEGAYCLAHTRDGRALKTILEECPGRWEEVEEDLGERDRCVVRRKGGNAGAVLLRNRSYGKEAPSAGRAGGH
jgi:hypothetical protein